MTRIFGHYVALEMAGLWLLDFVPCLFLLDLVLASGSAAGVADIAVFQHAAALALAVSLTWTAIGLYEPEICLRTRRLMLSTAFGAIAALPALFLVALACGIDTGQLFGGSPLRPAQFVFAWIAVLFATRLAFRAGLRLGLFARPVLILGTQADAAGINAAIAQVRAGFFRVIGIVPADDAARLAPLGLGRQHVWAVVVTERARAALPEDVLMRGKSVGLHIFSDVEFREQQLRRIDLDHLEPDWKLFAAGLTRGRIEGALRRAADVVLSLAVLLLTLPVMLLTALAIRLDSPGPVFYRQQRVGQHGKVFTLFKFRSMRCDAEAGGPTWATPHDSRATRVGRFIRHTRIDELPQLINVMRGEMSCVGPRPERPHFVDQLAEVIPFYRDRTAVKPGITGWAQVNYPYGASVEDARQKLSYDLYYVKRRSLFLDLLIIVATVRVILFQEGSR
jgi:sugar transferase (PEP-CTERM system associated)